MENILQQDGFYKKTERLWYKPGKYLPVKLLQWWKLKLLESSLPHPSQQSFCHWFLCAGQDFTLLKRLGLPLARGILRASEKKIGKEISLKIFFQECLEKLIKMLLPLEWLFTSKLPLFSIKNSKISKLIQNITN